MADHVAHSVCRHGRPFERRQRMVERRAQIGRCIDQRSIEVEDYGGGEPLHVFPMRRCGFPRQARYGSPAGVIDRTATPTPSDSKPPLAAIILAAGQGTRMRSAVHKVLHPIAAKPMLLHLLDSLDELSPQRSVLVVGAGREQVETAVAGRATSIAVQDRQLGTGHAVRMAEPALGGFVGDVLILFGDAPLVSAATMARLRAALVDDVAAAILAFRPADPAAYGRVLAIDGFIEKMVEFKDASPAERAIGLCNSGLLVIRAGDLWPLLARVGNENAAGEYYLPDIIGLLIADGRRARVIETAAHEVAGVNSRAELAAVEAAWQQRRRSTAMAAGVTLIDPGSVFFAHDTDIAADVTIEPFVVFGPGVRIAAGVTIRAHSHIAGADIGENCEIGPFARLRPGTVLEPNAKIGNFVETKNAVFGAGAKANHLSYIGDAGVGPRANIGAGTITCNYDGFFKYRTEIGAGAFIGSNSALVAPVSIGAGAIVAAGSTITADVAPDALALVRPHQVVKTGWAAQFRAAMTAKKSS
jgi:bifunctional UDP-N-acetylglucosamine pyrophosphorylase/glucosamine-1-phosphate N-acetyltransferase